MSGSIRAGGTPALRLPAWTVQEFSFALPSSRLICSARMKAAVLHGKEDVRVEDVAEHPLASGEARVRIEAALTCGTDLKVFKRG